MKKHYFMTMLLPVLVILLTAVSGMSPRQTTADQKITAEEFLENIKILASDEFGGRGNGTTGLEMAAGMIRESFIAAGLQPLCDNYYQTFKILTENEFGPENTLVFHLNGKELTLKIGENYVPVSVGEKPVDGAGVVFAGYGISAEKYSYDDYTDLDVKDKVVIIFALEPQRDKTDSVFDGAADTDYAQAQTKVLNARFRDAAGVLIVKGPLHQIEGRDEYQKMGPGYVVQEMGIPAANVSLGAIEGFLAEAGLDLKAEQDGIEADLNPRSKVLEGLTATLRIDVKPVRKDVHNVVGILPGTDPALKDEVIVIGAHYDHLGTGYRSSRSPDRIGQVHNGADDNASGTSGVIELAEYFGLRDAKPKRSLVFVAFAGEEWGILGSSWFVNNPPVPFENIITMVNMDMIGRPMNNKITVSGVGTSSGFEQLVTEANGEVGYDIAWERSGIGASDHAAFTMKDIPTLFFFTSLNPDYHTPDDDWQNINAEGGAKVLDLVAHCVDSLDALEKRPEFIKVNRPAAMAKNRGGDRPWFGSVPDFSFEGEGYRFQAVMPGSPAADAGLLPEDVMISLGGKPVKNIYDFTSALGAYKFGDEVVVGIMRGGKEMQVTVVLNKRKK